MRFRDIPQFTKWANYAVDVSWAFLPEYVKEAVEEFGLDTDPDFQRGYVWTPEQKVRYIEYILRGGVTGKDIHTNHPNWNNGIMRSGPYVLVDGKQRLNAILGFMNNEFGVFGGRFLRDFEDKPDILRAKVRWHVNDLATREDVLRWYLDLNCGGTVHTTDELDKVRAMIEAEKVNPTVVVPEGGLEEARLAMAAKPRKKGRSK